MNYGGALNTSGGTFRGCTLAGPRFVCHPLDMGMQTFDPVGSPTPEGVKIGAPDPDRYDALPTLRVPQRRPQATMGRLAYWWGLCWNGASTR